MTRLCHGLAPLHGPLSKRATATLAPTYTFPLDLNILRYIAPNLKFYAKRRSLIFVLVPSLALEVACEVLAPSLILVERALLC